MCSQSDFNLEVLVCVEGRKPENPEKSPRNKDENQQQTKHTCNAGSGNRTRATLVRGDCSLHGATPDSLQLNCDSTIGTIGSSHIVSQANSVQPCAQLYVVELLLMCVEFENN